MFKSLKKLGRDRSGATAIEYGLIAAFIALAMTAALPTINEKLGATFQKIADDADGAATSGNNGNGNN
jgi:pilus assembly protein Flp/PilA